MSLFDDIKIDEYIEDENKYLADGESAVKLISDILPARNYDGGEAKGIRIIDDMMDHRFLERFDKIQIPKAAELQLRLNRLSDRLNEAKKYRALRGKAIVGVGGKFSAGKSKFINSLLGIDGFLPEDQTPTTSISAYIISGEEKAFTAYTRDNRVVELESDSVQALTHKFYEKYSIGFSAFLDSIVITAPEMEYRNLAILDTPGYNKDDDSESGVLTKTQITDNETAKNQLLNVDFLIWLMSVDNGELSTSDISFIKELNPKSEILIVLNKADKLLEHEVAQVVEKVKETVKNQGINCFDVTAYSSFYKEEFFGKNSVSEFLSKANEKGYSNNDMRMLITELIHEIDVIIEDEISKCTKERNNIGDVIRESMDIFEIRSLVNIYSDLNKRLAYLRRSSASHKKESEELENMLKELLDDE